MNKLLKTDHLLQGGKYRIIKVLGQGGFGITYLAEQVLVERMVCIKEFYLKGYCDRDESTSQVSLGSSDNLAMMEEYQKKFLKEARMIARLDHPNITRIHDVFTENNTAYYVMEYIDGKNLNDLVKEKGALPEAEALSYIRQVSEGLAYVHGHKINHLDIKPGNIMLRKNGQPVLIDFGMSKQYDERGDQTSSTPIGVSAGYAPLELYQAGGVSSFSPQTDIYELAATLYRLVTGQVPPQASDVMNEGLPEKPVNVSESTWKAIKQAMDFRKKNRPSSIQEFLSLLGASAQGNESDPEESPDPEETAMLSEKPKSVVSKPTSKPKPHQSSATPAKKKNHTAMIAIGAVLVAILAVILLIPSGKSEDTSPVPVQPDSVEKPVVQEPATTPTPTPTTTSATTPATTSVTTPSSSSAPAKSSGSVSLPYGTYQGPLSSGKPNGEGKVTITKSYTLDNKSGKTYALEPGDYLDAEFKNGQLMNAYWYGADGTKKGSIVMAQ